MFAWSYKRSEEKKRRTYLLEAAVHHLQLSLRELGQLTERVQGFRSKVNVRTVHLLKFAV